MKTDDGSGRDDGGRYSIGELADLGGVSRRTVRYYIQRRLLPAPTGVGRGRHYHQDHLDCLIRIRELQESGLPLAEIAARLGPDGPDSSEGSESAGPPDSRFGLQAAGPSGPPAYSSWTRIEIGAGIELHLRDRRLDSRQARAVGEAVRGVLRRGEER